MQTHYAPSPSPSWLFHINGLVLSQMQPSTSPLLDPPGGRFTAHSLKIDGKKNVTNTITASSVKQPPISGKPGIVAADPKTPSQQLLVPHPAPGHVSAASSVTPKYAKIQPAIAIKPKPVVANGTAAAPPKSKFNPRYQPASSPLRQLFAAEDTPSANINTLKKWVLPPRPRPGRKPSAAQNLSLGLSDDERKLLSHKKHKLLRTASSCLEKPARLMARLLLLILLILLLLPPPCGSLPSTPRSKSLSLTPGSSSMATSVSAGSTGLSAADYKRLASVKPKPVAPLPHSSPTVKSETSDVPGLGKASQPLAALQKQVTDLQKTYLAKLKEQELVQNYIDILTNQIKELKFVQSGVITFDALDTSSSSRPQTTLSPPPDQLDHINNVRDLDAFLAHLTTQSNVIHSVTKKFVGDSLKEGSHIQLQIKHYLDLKANHTGSTSPFSKSNHVRGSQETVSMTADHKAINQASQDTYVPIEPNPNKDSKAEGHKPNSFFTSSFLRPLNMNLFEQEDGIINVDVINERDPFSGSVGSIEKRRLDSVVQSDIDVLNGAQQLNSKGFKKIGCGFCSNENPCLCFDADSVFGEK